MQSEIYVQGILKSGEIVKGEYYDLVIGVPVEAENTKTVVCIAAGKESNPYAGCPQNRNH